MLIQFDSREWWQSSSETSRLDIICEYLDTLLEWIRDLHATYRWKLSNTTHMPQPSIHCSENIINMLIKSQEDLLAPHDPPRFRLTSLTLCHWLMPICLMNYKCPLLSSPNHKLCFHLSLYSRLSPPVFFFLSFRVIIRNLSFIYLSLTCFSPSLFAYCQIAAYGAIGNSGRNGEKELANSANDWWANFKHRRTPILKCVDSPFIRR